MRNHIIFSLMATMGLFLLVSCAGKSNQIAAVCGNSAVEDGEECDPPGVGACTADCTRDTSKCGDDLCQYPEGPSNCIEDCPAGVCGNELRDDGEECDGRDLGGAACQTLGYPGGTLSCSVATCEFDVSQCTNPNCGNTLLDDGEECDSANLNGQSCGELGFDGGSLVCSNTCRYDDSDCYYLTCGNGTRDSGEECEDFDLGGATCSDFGYAGGVLRCNENCRYEKTGCQASLCGNLILNEGEQCDGGNLGGATCASRGYFGGALACHGNCTFNESGCTNCGNDTLNSGEECDGSNLGGKTCVTEGYDGGEVSCSASCTINDSLCYNSTCGNGVLDTGEECDGSNLNGASCGTLGYSGGTLACNANCTFNETNCTTNVNNCGNGLIDGGEQCDGANLNSKSCLTQGFNWGGTLACNSSCLFNTSQCYSSCWADRFETNNGSASATTVTVGTRYDDLTLCGGDYDWFKFNRAASTNYRVTFYFTGSRGDLDLEVYWYDGASVVWVGGAYVNNDGTTPVNNEVFEMPASFNGGATGTYWLRFYGEGTYPSNDTNLYSLQISTY